MKGSGAKPAGNIREIRQVRSEIKAGTRWAWKPGDDAANQHQTAA
jgi:hypothetical protein